MQVTVKLFATFRKGRFKVETFEYPDTMTVGDVIDNLKIPRKELGVIFLNGKSVDLHTFLQEGDVLSIFPMVGGG